MKPRVIVVSTLYVKPTICCTMTYSFVDMNNCQINILLIDFVTLVTLQDNMYFALIYLQCRIRELIST